MKIEGQVEKNAAYLEYNTKVHALAKAEVVDKTIIWHGPKGMLDLGVLTVVLKLKYVKYFPLLQVTNAHLKISAHNQSTLRPVRKVISIRLLLR